MSASLFSTDALPLIVVVIALLFAGVMTSLAKERGSSTFITLMFEGVTLGAALVVVVSIFYRPLFEWITEHSVFLIILALSSILNALKDIGATIDRSRSATSRKQQDVK